MIPEEVTTGARIRLCVSTQGHGYSFGYVMAFDGRDCLLEMDSGNTLTVPWWEIVEDNENGQGKTDPLAAMLCELPYMIRERLSAPDD